MNPLFLIRHGQAGTRNDYDRLSDLGHEQTRRLGRHLAGSGVQFRFAISGCLRRQRETAENTLASMENAPELLFDERWNEFDLDLVYRDIGPQLACDDAEFRAIYEPLLASWNDHTSEFHRAHSPADAMVVMAWIQGRYRCEFESWADFNARVRAAWEDASAKLSEGAVLVFTSATPTAIAISHATGAGQREMYYLLGTMYNAAINELARPNGSWKLLRGNAIPHLEDASLRSQR